MDEEFEEDELLEESDISDRRTLQVLGVMEENDVLERLEKRVQEKRSRNRAA